MFRSPGSISDIILLATGVAVDYDGEFDDLLFFYSHIYQTIQMAYKACLHATVCLYGILRFSIPY